MDWGGLLNFPCGAGIGYTKTYIHLLRRVADIGQTWANATEVAKYDCSTQCCFDMTTQEDSIPGNQGQYGWYIEFPPLHAMPANTTYEFLAIDDGDFKNLSVVDAGRTATIRITVQQDPAQVILPPISTGDGGSTTECDSGDYMCLYKDYIPYAVVGGIILVLLLTGGKK